MLKLPLLFNVESKAKSGISTAWSSTAANLPEITSAIPPEFGGSGQGYSPEDLFALAILNCMIATFKVYAEKSNIQFAQIHGKATLSMNKLPSENAFWMSDIEITLDVSGASNVDKAKTILENAVKSCAIGNSIKTGKTFHLKVS
jgi:organic hydroperoxide reductase OsmC/OhrA